jgi:type IV secretion system protein VirB4
MVSQSIADRWSAEINGQLFRNYNLFFIQIKPPEGFGEALEEESKKSINDNKGMLKSLIDGLTFAYSYKERLFSSIKELEFLIQKVDQYLRGFESGISFLKPKKLAGKYLMGVLTQYVSPDHDGVPVLYSVNSFIDNRIGTARLEVDSTCITMSGFNNKYAVVLSAKDFPEYSDGQLNAIAFLPFELTISQAMQFWDFEVADKHIDKQRDYFEQSMKPLLVSFKEWVSGEQLNQVDKGKELDFHDSNAAKAEHSAQRVAGLYNLTIVVYGDTEAAAVANAEVVYDTLKIKEFPMYRERMHALSAFAGTLPGQYQEPVRWYYFSGPNYSDLALIFSPRAGDEINAHLSEEAHREMSSLTLYKTPYHSPYHFNFHVGKLGHSFTIGPSRGGKSVFNNFNWTMYRQYGGQVFIFDKDKTCRIPTLLQSGQYVVPGVDKLKINPMLLLQHPGGQEFLVGWLEYLFTSRGYKFTTEDDKTLWTVIETLKKSVRAENLKLSSLATMLPSYLLVHLEPWINNGPMASFFDHSEDSFSLSDITAVDISRLFAINPTAAIAFMDYVFFRIELRLDGRPTIINIEELWYPMQHPKFAHKLHDWLRTKGKQNVLLLLSTQSLDELVKSESLSLFMGNIVTKIFVPNHAATNPKEAELYRHFGLSDADINVVATMKKNSEYYIVQEDKRQIIQAKFPKDILAVVMSDQHAQNIMDWALEKHPESFKSAYMNRLMSEWGAF